MSNFYCPFCKQKNMAFHAMSGFYVCHTIRDGQQCSASCRPPDEESCCDWATIQNVINHNAKCPRILIDRVIASHPEWNEWLLIERIGWEVYYEQKYGKPYEKFEYVPLKKKHHTH